METPRSLRVPEAIRPLIAEIERRVTPDSIWLFGSRARGDERVGSDWDLLIALPDQQAEIASDPLWGWELAKRSGLAATIVTTTTSDLNEAWGVPNTLGFVIAREGLLLER